MQVRLYLMETFNLTQAASREKLSDSEKRSVVRPSLSSFDLATDRVSLVAVSN